MKRLALAALVSTIVTHATVAAAHPVPFSYVDLHLQPGTVEVVIVAHMFDVGHDLHVDPAERLLDPAFLAAEGRAFVALLAPRFQLMADGTVLVPLSWSAAEPLPER